MTGGSPVYLILTDLLGVCTRYEAAESAAEDVRQRSGLKFARLQPLASSLGVLAARECLASVADAGRLGVIAAAGPQHLEVTWEFATRAVMAGPRFVNPLAFPYILPSSVPCAIASAIGARAVALAVGSDERAFLDALDFASRAIAFGFADSVLLAGISSVHPEADGPERELAAIAGLLTRRVPRAPHWRVEAGPPHDPRTGVIELDARRWGVAAGAVALYQALELGRSAAAGVVDLPLHPPDGLTRFIWMDPAAL